MNPTFYLIVGPNGAGKSELTEAVVKDNTVIINGDKIGMESPNLQQAAQKVDNLLKGSLLLKQSVSFETNFLDEDQTRNIYLPFKKNGYDLDLVFIGLQDLEESIIRINNRVTKGGHNIVPLNAELSFHYSKVNSLKYASDFNNITLIDNPVDQTKRQTDIVYMAKGNDVIINKDLPPKWAEEYIRHLENKTYPDIDIDNIINRKR